ncbi:ABC transporter substrate-binding protein [Photobacterium makurazakiensis]|uniref:ABC transporter substrate-binding protein n=1 Tax=Photobacterium makurazakiensis TaxID=2910234 RepID=UPI003D0F5C5A
MKQLFITVVLCLSMTPMASTATVTSSIAANSKTVYMVVWRGCEEACQGFKDYLTSNEYPVEVIVRDAGRDRSTLDFFLDEAKLISPDLVVTWGTSVTKALIGTRTEYGSETKLGQIPSLFMIVADPLGADIIAEKNKTGRPNVAGIRNRISEDVQIRAMREYLPVNKIGVVYSNAELNSVLNTQKLKALAPEMNFEIVEALYALDEAGKPVPNQFEAKISELATAGVDVVYVGSSSYNLANSDRFTQAAIKHGLPVASAYDSMVTDSSALISVSNKYYRVGQLAANQAVKILFEGMTPGELPIAELSRYSMSINMAVARKMSLFPPIQLMRFANLVNIETSINQNTANEKGNSRGSQ